MEPIPKPLLRRLVLTFLVGTGCFFTGLVFFLHEWDTSFFILGILLFTGSATKAILLGLPIRMGMNICCGSAKTIRFVPVFPTGFISKLQTASHPGKIRS